MEWTLQKLFNDLNNQTNKIGKQELKKYRLCPICFNYIMKNEYHRHFSEIHHYETIKIELEN